MAHQRARFERGIAVDTADTVPTTIDADDTGVTGRVVAAPDAFVWVDLAEPDVDELHTAATALGVPASALAVVTQEQARPRLEHHGHHLVVVLRTAVYVDPEEAVEVGQLALVVGARSVLSVATGPQPTARPRPHDDDLDPELLALGPLGVLAAVAGRVVRSYGTVLAGVDNDVDEIEAQVFSSGRDSHAQRIYRLKSEVLLFRRAVGALAEELDELLDDPDGRVAGDARLAEAAVRLRGVRAEAARVAEHVAALDDLLTGALNAHLAQIGIRQNEDMRRISAWVAVAAVPTAIAAVYGMNFAYMPELQWRYGYFAVLGVMATACVLLYRLFRRSGWL